MEFQKKKKPSCFKSHLMPLLVIAYCKSSPSTQKDSEHHNFHFRLANFYLNIKKCAFTKASQVSSCKSSQLKILFFPFKGNLSTAQITYNTVFHAVNDLIFLNSYFFKKKWREEKERSCWLAGKLHSRKTYRCLLTKESFLK